jgi:hypothetical protein
MLFGANVGAPPQFVLVMLPLLLHTQHIGGRNLNKVVVFNRFCLEILFFGNFDAHVTQSQGDQIQHFLIIGRLL